MLQKLNNFFLHYEKLDAKLPFTVVLTVAALIIAKLKQLHALRNWTWAPALPIRTKVIMGTKT